MLGNKYKKKSKLPTLFISQQIQSEKNVIRSFGFIRTKFVRAPLVI